MFPRILEAAWHSRSETETESQTPFKVSRSNFRLSFSRAGAWPIRVFASFSFGCVLFRSSGRRSANGSESDSSGDFPQGNSELRVPVVYAFVRNEHPSPGVRQATIHSLAG